MLRHPWPLSLFLSLFPPPEITYTADKNETMDREERGWFFCTRVASRDGGKWIYNHGLASVTSLFWNMDIFFSNHAPTWNSKNKKIKYKRWRGWSFWDGLGWGYIRRGSCVRKPGYGMERLLDMLTTHTHTHLVPVTLQDIKYLFHDLQVCWTKCSNGMSTPFIFFFLFFFFFF